MLHKCQINTSSINNFFICVNKYCTFNIKLIVKNSISKLPGQSKYRINSFIFSFDVYETIYQFKNWVFNINIYIYKLLIKIIVWYNSNGKKKK